MKRNQLTVSFVRGVTRPGRYGDGYGLMLVVQPTGSKSWIQRLVVHGKRRDLGLGPLDRVSLAQARKRAFENRNIAREGGDPAMGRSGVPTLAGAMESTIKVHAATWKATSKNEAQFRSMFGAYVLPRFGGRPVNSITAADVLAILAPLQAEKAETARKLRQRLGMVFKWAVTQGHRADDPTAAIGAALPKRGKTTEHHRALPFAEVAPALDTIRASKAWPATKLVIEFLALTAARSGEVRAATWAEVDFEGRTWTVPAARTKTGAEHRVPLSGAALALLRAATELSDGAAGSLIFPSMRGRGAVGQRAIEADARAEDRCRPAWAPFVVQGLVRRDGRRSRGCGSRARALPPGRGGGLSSGGSAWPARRSHGPMGGLSRRPGRARGVHPRIRLTPDESRS